jgi:NAD(P)-dependent dehydrogenase (short-subunit alcohol dehydrogenase family)
MLSHHAETQIPPHVMHHHYASLEGPAVATGDHLAQPTDVAAAVLFLLSDRNRFITGQSLVIDGGVIIQ